MDPIQPAYHSVGFGYTYLMGTWIGALNFLNTWGHVQGPLAHSLRHI